MNTTLDTDTALVERIARGDSEALGTLYDRHCRTAYALAARILRDRSLAEDAVQEAFLALWRGASGFDASRGTVSTWVHLLVHRRSVDLVRRAERQRAEELPEAFELACDETPEQLVVSHETASRVQTAVARLTASQREVIELAFLGGLSQSEVAERLGLPLGTVKSRTFAALSRLRDLLGESDERATSPVVSSELLPRPTLALHALAA